MKTYNTLLLLVSFVCLSAVTGCTDDGKTKDSVRYQYYIEDSYFESDTDDVFYEKPETYPHIIEPMRISSMSASISLVKYRSSFDVSINYLFNNSGGEMLISIPNLKYAQNSEGDYIFEDELYVPLTIDGHSWKLKSRVNGSLSQSDLLTMVIDGRTDGKDSLSHHFKLSINKVVENESDASFSLTELIKDGRGNRAEILTFVNKTGGPISVSFTGKDPSLFFDVQDDEVYPFFIRFSMYDTLEIGVEGGAEYTYHPYEGLMALCLSNIGQQRQSAEYYWTVTKEGRVTAASVLNRYLTLTESFLDDNFEKE